MEEHGCSPDMMREHESRISKVESSTEEAHKRMNNLEEFKDLMYEMNRNVGSIAEQIKHMAETLVHHDKAIEDIQEKMETKEGMARLYLTVEDLEARMTEEEQREGKAALKAINRIKWWFMGAAGAILLAVVMLYLGLR